MWTRAGASSRPSVRMRPHSHMVPLSRECRAREAGPAPAHCLPQRGLSLLSEDPRVMDVLMLLKDEHDEAKAVFKKLEKAKGDQAQRLWDQLRSMLTLHEDLE